MPRCATRRRSGLRPADRCGRGASAVSLQLLRELPDTVQLRPPSSRHSEPYCRCWIIADEIPPGVNLHLTFGQSLDGTLAAMQGPGQNIPEDEHGGRGHAPAQNIGELDPPPFLYGLIRMLVGIAVMAGMMISLAHFGNWLGEIHGNLLAGWTSPFLLAIPAGILSGVTIMNIPTNNWPDTALVCFAGIIAGIQGMVGMIAAALLMSHWYPTVPDGVFLRPLPALAGIALASPLIISLAILVRGRGHQQHRGT